MSNMPKTTPADLQILDILADLQGVLGNNLTKLDADEIVRVRKILKHGEALVQIAKYEEAKGLIGAKWRGLILGVSAVLAALVAFWTNIEKIAGKIAGLFQ